MPECAGRIARRAEEIQGRIYVSPNPYRTKASVGETGKVMICPQCKGTGNIRVLGSGGDYEDWPCECKATVKPMMGQGLVQINTITGKLTSWGGTTLRMPATPEEVRSDLEAAAERERVMREALVRIRSEPHWRSGVIATEALAAVDRKEV
jgi:hypothetical protein